MSEGGTTPERSSIERTREEADADAKRRRIESATAAFGPLALVNTQVIDIPGPVWGAPGTWAPLPDGQSGLLFTASAADGVEVDGVLVDGTTVVAGADAVVPSEIVFGSGVRGTVVRSDGGGYAVRVWDAASDAIGRFGGIDSWPYDPAWVLHGSVDGDIVRFDREGETVRLEAMARRDAATIQVVFSDATSGEESYLVGRFLFLEPDAVGNVVVDFNRAVLPPCAFSYNFNCPIPPESNRLPFAVRAGEKNVLDSAGAIFH